MGLFESEIHMLWVTVSSLKEPGWLFSRYPCKSSHSSHVIPPVPMGLQLLWRYLDFTPKDAYCRVGKSYGALFSVVATGA